MKSFISIQGVKREIDSYEQHFTGAPLLIGIDGNQDYADLLGLLGDDFGKRIVHMSDSCTMDFPPDPTFQISSISKAAKEKPIVWIGAAQAIMLYGQQKAEKFFVKLLGSSFSGPVTVLCPFCCNILESIGRSYAKLGYNIITVNSADRNIPTIFVSSEDVSYAGVKAVHGIKELLQTLEEGTNHQNILLITSCKYDYLVGSMYPTSEGLSPYQIVCQKEPGIAARTKESNGSPAQWQKLALELQSFSSLETLCAKKLCSVKSLRTDFGDYLAADQYTRFLCFISLKIFYGDDNSYISYCLQKAASVDDFEKNIYLCILDFNHNDEQFAAWMRQRKRLLSSMNDNDAMLKEFCARATIKGKDILWYLSDETEDERAAIIHALCAYPFTSDELLQILPIVSPQLAEYMQKFTFDEFNTKVMESNAYIHSLFTDYFQRYKLQKITNHQDPDFIELVETEAINRSFRKLQTRSTIVKKIDKQDAQPYFIDALGVEFLAFIQSRAEAYGMQFECSIGQCNLPSITSKNKEFYEAFPDGNILKEEGLDELKHRGTKYDFRVQTEPLHIFDELRILDNDLKRMSSQLALGACKKVIIMSDHGASRLAVTYRSENDKIAMPKDGQHSGRCCPADDDPHMKFVTYQDGYAILANYERFKGSRKADVETHGGASLEETVVPVITLTLKPKEQLIYFVDTTVICSLTEGARINLFANPPLKAPRMVVNDQNYIGQFDGDKHNVIFEMPDIRRRSHHEAEIYDGGVKVATLSFDTKRYTKINDDL